MAIPDIAGSIIDAYGAGRQVRKQREDEDRASQFRSLAAQAYGATPEQRESITQQAIALDPESGMQLDTAMQTWQDKRTQRLGVMSKALVAAADPMKPMIYKQMQPELARMGIGNLPPEYDETVASTAQQLASTFEAMSGGAARTEARVVGNALVDPFTGKVLYQGERQQNRQLVQDAEGNYYSVDPADPANATPVQIGGGSPQVGSAEQPAPAIGAHSPQQAYRDAIADIESAGSGDYSALGPVTRSGDRAYGRYQVMGANIPQWTQAALGRRLTPQEFLADADAQDAVFDHRFGGYAKKYGPEGAARAWFAGEGGMKNPDARDVLGTSVQGYGRRFAQAVGGRQLQGVGKGQMTEAQMAANARADRAEVRAERADARAQTEFEAKQSGQLTPVQRQKVAATAAKESRALSAANAEIDETVSLIDEILSKRGDFGGVTGIGSLGAKIPGSDWADLNTRLERLRGRSAFNSLQQMRASSPTGGALGSVTERELGLLQNAAAALNSSQSPQAMEQSLKQYRTQLLGAKKRMSTTFNETYSDMFPTSSPRKPAAGGFRILD